MMLRLLILAALLTAGALGQTCSKNGTLSVPGTGSAEAQPDIAKVYLNVASTAKSAKAARERAATVATKVIAAVDEVEGINAADDVTTLDVSVQPSYTYDQEKGTQNITGYTFTQNLQVKVNNLTNDVLGAVIDAAVLAGGNDLQVQSIQAELSPELKQATTNKARTLAVQDAISAAEVLAQAAGVTLGAITSLMDSGIGTPYVPVATPNTMGAAAAAKVTTSTPVNVGTATITSTVSLAQAICSS